MVSTAGLGRAGLTVDGVGGGHRNDRRSDLGAIGIKNSVIRGSNIDVHDFTDIRVVGTIQDHILNSVWGFRQIKVGIKNRRQRFQIILVTCDDSGLRHLVRIDCWNGRVFELRLEVVEVFLDGDRTIACNFHQTSPIDTLAHFVESSWGFGDAAVLGEKHRDRGVRNGLVELAVAGRSPVGHARTPFVRVDTKEVGLGKIVLIAVDRAKHVRQGGLSEPIFQNVGGGVADRDGSVGVIFDVLLDISLNGTEILWIDCSRSFVVDDLVTTEESEQVRVVFESVNHLEHPLHVGVSVRFAWVVSVQRLARERRINIYHDVYARRIEDRHTLIVVELRVHSVNPDNVDFRAQVLQNVSVSVARLWIGKNVGGVGVLVV
ncbi:hypothetical protein OGATHE_006068 [Ogataea polymorpha]|uniref:Uncharacterized protein n=1 Tax=Ogataea polymorpha TaxID=460523 RepID=A0A9P8NTC9_9ASCO|nr:hypothetical protein OGATHE_006068 [Ogataea polymorpha]